MFSFFCLFSKDANTISIITLGSLSNIAAAYVQNPGIMKRAKQLIIMGGNVVRTKDN
jgi:inosine-uridine nucleoside N-ribohydrolase